MLEQFEDKTEEDNKKITRQYASENAETVALGRGRGDLEKSPHPPFVRGS
jgi:hypothetical protein